MISTLKALNSLIGAVAAVRLNLSLQEEGDKKVGKHVRFDPNLDVTANQGAKPTVAPSAAAAHPGGVRIRARKTPAVLAGGRPARAAVATGSDQTVVTVTGPVNVEAFRDNHVLKDCKYTRLTKKALAKFVGQQLQSAKKNKKR